MTYLNFNVILEPIFGSQRVPRPSHGDTHPFELAVLEPTFTLGHSSSKNDSTNLDTYKKQSSTWQKPKIGFVQFGSRVE